MSLRLRRLVPEGYDHWYYHEETGLLLHNNSEYGWIAINRKSSVVAIMEELEKAINGIADSDDGFTNPSEVLPLPDDYEHALPPSWERDQS